MTPESLKRWQYLRESIASGAHRSPIFVKASFKRISFQSSFRNGSSKEIQKVERASTSKSSVSSANCSYASARPLQNTFLGRRHLSFRWRFIFFGFPKRNSTVTEHTNDTVFL